MGVVGLLLGKKPSSSSQSVVADEQKTLGAAVSKKTQATGNKAITKKHCINTRVAAVVSI